MHLLDSEAESLTLSRRGVGTPLHMFGIPISDFPESVLSFIEERKPRVELFKMLGGNLPDAVKADEINSDEFEFMQGLFFFAGLDPRQSATLFNQNDITMRTLDVASKQLDENLGKLWAQGTDLHFELRHQAEHEHYPIPC